MPLDDIILPFNFSPVPEKYNPWYINGKRRVAKQSSAKARKYYTPGLTGKGKWVLDTVPPFKSGDTPTISPSSVKAYTPHNNLSGVVVSSPTTTVSQRSRPAKSSLQANHVSRQPPHKSSRFPSRWAVPTPSSLTSPNWILWDLLNLLVPASILPGSPRLALFQNTLL